MATLNTYLSFNGNTEEVFNFYKSVFGGEFATLHRFGDSPEVCGNVADNDKDKIMHVSLPIGNGYVLMASDNLESTGRKVVGGNNFSISINAESEEEAEKLFNGLSAGGNVTMPLDKCLIFASCRMEVLARKLCALARLNRGCTPAT